jgi:membrane protein YqaA with SNARE-associated domain
MATGLWTLFTSAFISSTLFPGGSEAVLWLLADDYTWLSLWAVATAGNSLGGMSTWLIGRVIAWRYPAGGLSGEKHRVAVERLRRWGSPALLLSWLPLIGDPLCLAAGWLRIDWRLSLLLITSGKGARYAALLWLVSA